MRWVKQNLFPSENNQLNKLENLVMVWLAKSSLVLKLLAMLFLFNENQVPIPHVQQVFNTNKICLTWLDTMNGKHILWVVFKGDFTSEQICWCRDSNPRSSNPFCLVPVSALHDSRIAAFWSHQFDSFWWPVLWGTCRTLHPYGHCETRKAYIRLLFVPLFRLGLA